MRQRDGKRRRRPNAKALSRRADHPTNPDITGVEQMKPAFCGKEPVAVGKSRLGQGKGLAVGPLGETGADSR